MSDVGANPGVYCAVTDADGVIIELSSHTTAAAAPTQAERPNGTVNIIPWYDLTSADSVPATTQTTADVPLYRLVEGRPVLRSPAAVHQDIQRKRRQQALEGLMPVRAQLREVDAEIAEQGSSPARTALRNRLVTERDRLRQEAR